MFQGKRVRSTLVVTRSDTSMVKLIQKNLVISWRGSCFKASGIGPRSWSPAPPCIPASSLYRPASYRRGVVSGRWWQPAEGAEHSRRHSFKKWSTLSILKIETISILWYNTIFGWLGNIQTVKSSLNTFKPVLDRACWKPVLATCPSWGCRTF